MNRANVDPNDSHHRGICHRPAPPLTSDDIIALRGKPAASKINISQPTGRAGPVGHKGGNSTVATNKEWIYFNTNCEEHYFFKDEQLIHWKKIPYQYDRSAVRL